MGPHALVTRMASTPSTAVPRTNWRDGELELDAPAGLRVWLLDLLHPLDTAHWQACSSAEHEKAGRFRFEKDALRYRAAHAGLRRVLARELGMAARDVRWHVGTQGKPHLAGREGWHFNLSHSGDWALLGLGQGAPIGVDIECPGPSADIDLLVSHQFNAAEQAAFAQCPPSARAAFFYRMWVRKEACVKALGCGLVVEPRRIAVPVDAVGEGQGASPRDPLAHGQADPWMDAQAHSDEARFALEVRDLTLPPEAGLAQAAVARVPRAVLAALTATGW